MSSLHHEIFFFCAAHLQTELRSVHLGLQSVCSIAQWVGVNMYEVNVPAGGKVVKEARLTSEFGLSSISLRAYCASQVCAGLSVLLVRLLPSCLPDLRWPAGSARSPAACLSGWFALACRCCSSFAWPAGLRSTYGCRRRDRFVDSLCRV
jgi:hypothetical protein